MTTKKEKTVITRQNVLRCFLVRRINDKTIDETYISKDICRKVKNLQKEEDKKCGKTIKEIEKILKK